MAALVNKTQITAVVPTDPGMMITDVCNGWQLAGCVIPILSLSSNILEFQGNENSVISELLKSSCYKKMNLDYVLNILLALIISDLPAI